jgi:CMP-N,N'-diacetyllegionaminic acid synthase
MTRLIAVIPARAGSKGLPGKNKRMLSGKPLVAHSVDFALNAKVFDHIIVTSDDNDILDYTSKVDGVTNIRRPEEFAADNSTTKDVIFHLRKEFVFHDEDALVLLQPTSPFRKQDDLVLMLQLYNDYDGKLPVTSIVKVDDCHPARMYYRADNIFKSLDAKHFSKRRQDLPTFYLRNGSIYIRNILDVLRHGFTSDEMLGYEMTADYSINIDSEMDFKLAELCSVSYQ